MLMFPIFEILRKVLYITDFSTNTFIDFPSSFVEYEGKLQKVDKKKENGKIVDLSVLTL